MILQSCHAQEFVEDVHQLYENDANSVDDVYFTNKNFKYVWQEDSDEFRHLR